MIFQLNDIEIDTKQYRITQSGAAISVEPKVFDAIVYLIENRDRLISRDELFEKIWKGRPVSDTTLSNHIKSARKVLGDNGERQGIIKTVRARGYQFVANIKEIPSSHDSLITSSFAASTPKASAAGTVTHAHRLSLVKIGVLFCALIAAGVVWLTLKPKAIVETKPYVLVVPFSVSSNESDAWEPFADQITRELIQDLRKISGIRVVPPPSSFTFKFNKVRSYIRKQLPEVTYVLDGIISDGNDGNIRITVELENINEGKLVWDDDFDIQVNNTNRFNVQADIAASVSKSLQVVVLDEEKRTLAKVPTSSLRAYDLYVKGQYQFSLMSHVSVLQAIDYFSQAIKLDPKFKEAYLAKSDAYRIIMNLFEKPKDVLPKVITSSIDVFDVNAESALARSSLGVAYVHAWLWKDAWKMLSEAKQRDPSLALTELGFALYYSAIGDFAALKQSLARADKLDPLNQELAEWGMWALMMANQMETATKWGEEKLALHPGIPYPLLSLAVAEYINGNYERSIILATKGVKMGQRGPFPLVILAQAYAAAGQIDKVRPLLAEAKAQNEYMCPYETAIVYAIMDEADAVFDLLDKAVEYRSNCLIFTKHDPRLKSMRNDPRYAVLLKTVGLDDESISQYRR